MHCTGKLLNHFNNHNMRIIWFTDEKVFTISTTRNSQNDMSSDLRRNKAIAPEQLFREQSL